MKAATQLQLKVLTGNDPKIADLTAQLPVGRVHATGRTFVPFIRRDLYDKLLAAAGNGNLAQPPSPPASGASGNAAGSRPPGSSPKLPRNWQEIGVGDLVLFQECLEDGWYEAIVVEAVGDMFTLRWRDYPRQRRFACHRLRLGLLYPGPKPSVETGKSAKAAGRAKHDKTVETNHAANGLWRSPKIGMRLISIIWCWPRPKARGRIGSRPYRSKGLATASSCAGAIMATCRRSSGRGSTWR